MADRPITITFRVGPVLSLLMLFANTCAFAVCVGQGLWFGTYVNLTAAALHLANLRANLVRPS